MEAVVTALGDLARIVQDADPQDKADIYTKLRLTLTYQPEEKEVQAIVTFGLNMPKGVVSEGDLNTETGAISPDRGNHAIKVTRPGQIRPVIPRRVRHMVRYLACM